MSFLIDPPWLYANGRAYAALAPERAQGRTAAAAGAATMAVFWGVSISLYLNRPWTRWIWRLCRAERRARLDAQLRRAAARPARRRAGDARRQRGAVRQLPLLAVARMARRAARMTAARFPHVAPGKGHYESFYLRAVDPERPRGAWIRYTTHQRPGGPPTGSVWCTYSDAEAGAAVRRQADAAGPGGRPGRLDRDRRERVRAARRARPGRGRGPLGRLGARDARRRRAAAPPPARVDVPRAAAAHQAREPAPERDVRRHARDRRRAAASRSRAGAAWPATTGAPSTRRPGSGCTASRSRASRTRGWTSRSGACASGRCSRRGSPTGRCTSAASARGSAARGPRACEATPEGCRVETCRRGRRGALPRRPDRRLALRRPRRRRAPLAQLLDRGGHRPPRGARAAHRARRRLRAGHRRPAPTASSCSRSRTARSRDRLERPVHVRLGVREVEREARQPAAAGALHARGREPVRRLDRRGRARRSPRRPARSRARRGSGPRARRRARGRPRSSPARAARAPAPGRPSSATRARRRAPRVARQPQRPAVEVSIGTSAAYQPARCGKQPLARLRRACGGTPCRAARAATCSPRTTTWSKRGRPAAASRTPAWRRRACGRRGGRPRPRSRRGRRAGRPTTARR